MITNFEFYVDLANIFRIHIICSSWAYFPSSLSCPALPVSVSVFHPIVWPVFGPILPSFFAPSPAFLLICFLLLLILIFPSSDFFLSPESSNLFIFNLQHERISSAHTQLESSFAKFCFLCFYVQR